MVCNISTCRPTSIFHINLVSFKFHSILVFYRIPHTYSARGRLTLSFFRWLVGWLVHSIICPVTLVLYFRDFESIQSIYFYEFIFDAENNDGHAHLCAPRNRNKRFHFCPLIEIEISNTNSIISKIASSFMCEYTTVNRCTENRLYKCMCLCGVLCFHF